MAYAKNSIGKRFVSARSAKPPVFLCPIHRPFQSLSAVLAALFHAQQDAQAKEQATASGFVSADT